MLGLVIAAGCSWLCYKKKGHVRAGLERLSFILMSRWNALLSLPERLRRRARTEPPTAENGLADAAGATATAVTAEDAVAALAAEVDARFEAFERRHRAEAAVNTYDTSPYVSDSGSDDLSGKVDVESASKFVDPPLRSKRRAPLPPCGTAAAFSTPVSASAMPPAFSTSKKMSVSTRSLFTGSTTLVSGTLPSTLASTNPFATASLLALYRNDDRDRDEIYVVRENEDDDDSLAVLPGSERKTTDFITVISEKPSSDSTRTTATATTPATTSTSTYTTTTAPPRPPPPTIPTSAPASTGTDKTKITTSTVSSDGATSLSPASPALSHSVGTQISPMTPFVPWYKQRMLKGSRKKKF